MSTLCCPNWLRKRTVRRGSTCGWLIVYQLKWALMSETPIAVLPWILRVGFEKRVNASVFASLAAGANWSVRLTPKLAATRLTS